MKETKETMELLTQKQVLEIYKIKRSAMYNWINIGNFPKPLKLGARVARWNKEDIDKWLTKKHENTGNVNE